jgi:pimeloyl-ACP methyl ester carboxylesterase
MFRSRVLTRLVMMAVALGTAGIAAPHSSSRVSTMRRATVRVWHIHYVAHNQQRRNAYVILPAWYGPANAPALPLIISPHGRGLTGSSSVGIWGDLPARGPFAVVSPDGQGRRLQRHSWGFGRQIDDLARMPQIVTQALPWLRVDRRRVFAFGGSMGGQETLLLAARYPRLLAGAAAFDSVVDFGLQYRAFPRLRCNARCHRMWAGSVGRGLQRLARLEVGSSPDLDPRSYAARSPITYARGLAFSCVPLQLWWSVSDLTVINQRRQSGRLFRQIRRLNPGAPLHGFKGFWTHGAEMHARSRLPLALATFSLLPPPSRPVRPLHVLAPLANAPCSRTPPGRTLGPG